MIELTVGDLIKDDLSDVDSEAYDLYVVRKGNIVFYVGQSQSNVINRLWQHLGIGGEFRQAPSLLGRFIQANLPNSVSFQIELLTSQEVSPKYYLPHHIDKAEQELIRRLHPCLNISHNNNPSPLPECYIDPRIPTEEEERTMKEAVDKMRPLPYRKRNRHSPAK